MSGLRIDGPIAKTEWNRLQVLDFQNAVVVHYACSSIEGEHPEVRCIAVQTLIGATVERFNISEETSELEALSAFYEYVQANPKKVWIHWNMRAGYYGFSAIEKRFRSLGGEPLSIPESHKVNLAQSLDVIYGREYAPHPKLINITRMNKIDTRYHLEGVEEASLDAVADSGKLAYSTERKVQMIGELFRLAVEDRLVVNEAASQQDNQSKSNKAQPDLTNDQESEIEVDNLAVEEKQADGNGHDVELAGIIAEFKHDAEITIKGIKGIKNPLPIKKIASMILDAQSFSSKDSLVSKVSKANRDYFWHLLRPDCEPAGIRDLWNDVLTEGQRAALGDAAKVNEVKGNSTIRTAMNRHRKKLTGYSTKA
jgi:hypothetical protein